MNADFTEMLDHLSETLGSPQATPDAEPGDLLTEILLGLRLDGVDYNRCLHHAPWAVAIPAKPSASFHFVSQGGAWLRTAKSDWLPLQAGDAVLLPHGSFHVMASAPDLPAIDIESLVRKPVADKLFLIDARDSAHADAQPTHVLFGGAMRFNLDPLHPLMSMMPEVMVAGNLSARDASVPALLDAMEREVALNRIGGCGILARLADALAACIIRAWVECSCNQPTGWIAAVRCPRIGRVIAAIHANPEKPWTVPELASVMAPRARPLPRPSAAPWARARRSTSPKSRCFRPGSGWRKTACASPWWPNAWATSPRPRSAARSNASSATRPAWRGPRR